MLLPSLNSDPLLPRRLRLRPRPRPRGLLDRNAPSDIYIYGRIDPRRAGILYSHGYYVQRRHRRLGRIDE